MQLSNRLLIVVVMMTGLLAAGCARHMEAVAPDATVVTVHYVGANGQQLRARFDQNAKSVTVWPPQGGAVTLPLAMSASGARYSNGKQTFWEHQGVASFWQGNTLVFKGPLAR